MVKLAEIESGKKYKFIINQKGNNYEATVKMDTAISPTTGTAVGNVQDSTYPNNSWEGEQFRFHENGRVEIPGDPFGDIGSVERVSEA